MHLPLTPEVLRQGYEFLAACAPFNKWNLPQGEDVKFIVSRDPRTMAWHNCKRGRHTIAVSSKCVSHLDTLTEALAHEMIHLHMTLAGMNTTGEHNAAFYKLASKVAAILGFDPKRF